MIDGTVPFCLDTDNINSPVFYYVDLEEPPFVRKTNGMANGPKMAPIVAQNSVFFPLLSAIDQSIIAHAIHITEMIINPTIQILPY